MSRALGETDGLAASIGALFEAEGLNNVRAE